MAKPKERTLKRPEEALHPQRFQIGIGGEIISEWWAISFRNDGRFEIGMMGDFARNQQTYRYWFIMDPTAAGIKATAGNYAFVKQLPNGNFTPLYFGESEDVQSRIPGYDRWEVARRVGVTHVMGHTSPVGVVARLAEERDLIQQWHPLLNTQHRQVS